MLFGLASLPMSDPPTRLTQILGSQDPSSSEQLLPLVYDELRRLARGRLAQERTGQTLQPTALVHETFLRLGCPSDPKWGGRRHYFGAAAEAMRRILIEQARRKQSLRHGGGQERHEIDDQELAIEAPGVDLLAVDDALKDLEAVDPRAREIVNLRFFVGLSTPETAEALGVSVSTIEREWRFLRVFLQQALGGQGER
mgnify:FL=1|tara:strand:+ start:1609 stop:2202 length:594 start_codon:yes stop_codon:yes gene_type:complete